MSPIRRIPKDKRQMCIDKKLLDKAIKKAESSGVGFLGNPKDDFQLTLFKGMNPKRLSPADRDVLHLYLFGSTDGVDVKRLD